MRVCSLKVFGGNKEKRRDLESEKAQHLQWCKDRALEYVDMGDLKNAYASFLSDMKKHPETANHPALGLGFMLMMGGNLSTAKEMRKFIIDFN